MAPEMSIHNRRWVALVVLCLGQLMIVLDTTVVNVVLPVIQRQLHFAAADLSWVVDAYLISFGSFLLVAGRLGDILGRKKVFLTGVALFTSASAVCGLAATPIILIIGRFGQGLAAAITASVILGIIAAEFPSSVDRARAVGVFAFVGVAGGALGLLVGGAVAQAASWHWVFLINLPIGIVTFGLGRVLIVDRPPTRDTRHLDLTGALLITVSVMLLVYAIAESDGNGWTSAKTLGLLSAAAGLLIAFIAVEARVAAPLLPLRLVMRPGPAANFAVRGLLSVALIAPFYLTVLYLQHVRHYNAVRTGLAYLPQASTIGLVSILFTARIMRWKGPKATMVAGLVVVAGGEWLLGRLGPSSSYMSGVLPAVVLIGFGSALAFTPTVTMALEGAPAADAGVVSALINVTQQLSSAVGVAVVASVAAAGARSMESGGTSLPIALVGGYDRGYAVVLGCALAAVVIAVLSPAHGGQDHH